MNNKKNFKKKFMVNDSISDMLTRIRNACLAKKSTVSIPYTRLNQEIAQILEKEGYILTVQMALSSKNQSSPSLSPSPLAQQKGAQLGQKRDLIIRLKYNSRKIYKGKKKESCVSGLRRISRPSLRIYTNSREIPLFLGGTGIVILSTPIGVLTGREAQLRGVGGEILCSVW